MEGTLGSRCPGDGGDLSHGLWKVGNWSTGTSRPSQAFPAGVWGIRPGMGETGGSQPQSLRAQGTALGGLGCFATTHPLGAPQGSGHSQEALSQAKGGGRCRESGRRGPRPQGRGQWGHTVPSPASQDKAPQGPGRPPTQALTTQRGRAPKTSHRTWHYAALAQPPPRQSTGRQLVAAGGPPRRITPRATGRRLRQEARVRSPPTTPWQGSGRGQQGGGPGLPPAGCRGLSPHRP